jgi:hypothetical protein
MKTTSSCALNSILQLPLRVLKKQRKLTSKKLSSQHRLPGAPDGVLRSWCATSVVRRVDSALPRSCEALIARQGDCMARRLCASRLARLAYS